MLKADRAICLFSIHILPVALLTAYPILSCRHNMKLYDIVEMYVLAFSRAYAESVAGKVACREMTLSMLKQLRLPFGAYSRKSLFLK